MQAIADAAEAARLQAEAEAEARAQAYSDGLELLALENDSLDAYKEALKVDNPKFGGLSQGTLPSYPNLQYVANNPKIKQPAA